MKLSKIKSLDKLTEPTRYLCETWLKACNRVGLYPVVIETYRSKARQQYLYQQGRTRPGKIVTNMQKPAMHGKGLAFDFAMKKNGSITWSDTKLYDKALDIGEKLGLSSLRPFERSHLENRNQTALIPSWAMEAKRKADEKGIHYGNLFADLTPESMQSILYDAGVINKKGEMPVYRFLVALQKLGKL